MPSKKGLIRGNSILSGYYVRRIGDGCSLTYVSQVDLKGNFSQFVALFPFFTFFIYFFMVKLLCEHLIKNE